MSQLLDYLPAIGTAAACLIALLVASKLLDRWQTHAPGLGTRSQLIMLGLTASAILLVILVLPLDNGFRGQILSFVAILLSATIALSSTTFLGNGLAGLMLRAVRNFRMGDFIRVGDHFGRVSERGLFHTEIQTEDRELTTLPNLYLVTHPVTTLRSSGTIISASVTLGYDVPRARLEELLLEAAGKAELTDPFVQILELGDFSVTYRVAGLLSEVKQLISARSHLRGCVLDTVHEAGIEVVSPRFMNTRALEPGSLFIPPMIQKSTEDQTAPAPEAVLFDKAEDAESLETLRIEHGEAAKKLADLEKQLGSASEDSQKEALAAECTRLESHKEELGEHLATREEDTKTDPTPV